MTQPTTTKFGKMRVMLGENAFITGLAVTSLTNTNPAQCTVSAANITAFKDGYTVRIAGATATMIAGNGDWSIYSVGNPANTFKLFGCNLAGGAAPQTTGVTAAPKTGALTYSVPCGFTTKGLTVSKNLTEVLIPDCDDPDAPIWLGRDLGSLSCQISGEGVAAAESVPKWNEAATQTGTVPMKVEVEFVNGQKTFTGNFHVDNLTFSAEQGGRVQLAMNAQSDGPVTDLWVPM